jgi:general stress protein 26
MSVKEEVDAIMARHNTCVLSTVATDGKPESAIVGFSHGKNLELLVGTSHKTRKYANIKQNPNVAVVIGDKEAEIQYEGVIRELDLAEAEKFLKRHFEKLIGTEKYLNDPYQRWLAITPMWLRLTTHSDHDRIEELRQFS